MAAISKKLNDALSDQIQKEIASAYFYLSLAADCEALNFKGAMSWLRLQWQEELAHALKIVDFVHVRGNRVDFKAIEKPGGGCTSLLEVFEATYEHERGVTQSINALYDLACQEKDFAAQTFLQWFITEQIEEENSADEIVQLLRMAGDNNPALLLVDQQLGARTSAPAAE